LNGSTKTHNSQKTLRKTQKKSAETKRIEKTKIQAR